MNKKDAALIHLDRGDGSFWCEAEEGLSTHNMMECTCEDCFRVLGNKISDLSRKEVIAEIRRQEYGTTNTEKALRAVENARGGLDFLRENSEGGSVIQIYIDGLDNELTKACELLWDLE